jgi:uncharacterized protein with FMN-binding domain
MILIAVGLFVITSFFRMTKDQEAKVKDLVFEKIDMTKVKDDTYVGEADTGMVFVKVEVVVKDHQITDITILKHDNGLGGKAEKIINTIIKNNTYEVDTINGATTSSQTIKSAISKALVQGID